MKSVLISIQPKWCDLIASGKKTIEVRKTRPKIDTPFKVYIYQTKKPVSVSFSGTGRHISEYEKTCYYTNRSGKVIGEFVCDCIMPFNSYEIMSGCSETSYEELPRATQLSREELLKYCGDGEIYTWHISDLVIYDKPKELSEFYRHDTTYDNSFGWAFEDRVKETPITRPPQSWCYIEHMDEKGGVDR